MAIRYDKKLNQEINKTIKNFNQKIARLEKTENDLILPDKITKIDLKNSVGSRKELKRRLSELQRYSKRGIENTIKTIGGAELSIYEYTNLRIETTIIKKQITRELTRLEMTSPKIFGKSQTYSFAQMGDEYYLNLKTRRKALEKKGIENLSSEQLKNYQKLIYKTYKNKNYYDTIFKKNYFDMLTSTAKFYKYDQDKLDLLEQRLNKLDRDKFLRLFRDEKSIQAVLNYYKEVTKGFIDPKLIEDDVKVLYDELIDNIEDIVKDYA